MRLANASLAFAVTGAILFTGCAEESLDMPVSDIPAENSQVQPQTAEVSEINSNEAEVGNGVVEVPANEESESRPSAVKSIFNALKSGAAEALDQSPADQ